MSERPFYYHCPVPFTDFTQVPDRLKCTFPVDYWDGGQQVVNGISEETFTSIFDNAEKPFIRNGEPRAVGFWPYRIRTLEVFPHLKPYASINYNLAAKLDIEVAMIWNRNFNIKAGLIRNKDKITLGPLAYPGRSAHINFTGVCQARTPDDIKAAINLYKRALLNQTYVRTDGLHLISVEDLFISGFTTYLAPLKNEPLHLRIVDNVLRDKLNKGQEVSQDDLENSARRLVKNWASFF
ncbi:hypothetical protein A3F03_00145 [Candidatus Roizmanbacteria bacterium RIFCSPHIGHO2_12_FULL_41_11]|uniref:Uncharacterized protein n=3 Tax=Candidatus Roizmaniibacteriota TaxID=1752723 RepID=A0A1F7JRS2_9BACT|nr:MAG: hypothetical protein A3F03_00145 [Candidatus Roizmanbacteria bacterium RIFCSPHIGHO2_12_FULL_41_11]OGK52379.1 MAG: hypothetical protein A2966_01780 [Candidatus Roizmanbacteria bacterium RIFCSPLOWO2_01_FULL_41_22]OGK58277.1 MAG: hypothetical protein A3H86_01420 [Candidatus Roizmanbacteria bacterium RIFCSPLOWO2_02_FULL_41_9]